MSANTEMARLDIVEKDKITSILDAQTLPETSSSDNGKYLGVYQGKWAKRSLPSDLPEVSSDDNGKVLMVVDGAWAVASLPTEGTGR